MSWVSLLTTIRCYIIQPSFDILSSPFTLLRVLASTAVSALKLMDLQKVCSCCNDANLWCGASFRQWFFLFCVFCVQLMVNCWFGLVVWILGIPLWKGLLLNGTLRIPNHRAPNQQLTISWCVWLCLLDFGLVPAPVSSNLLYRSPISMFPSFSMTGMMRINLDLWRVFTQMMIPQVIKKVDN